MDKILELETLKKENKKLEKDLYEALNKIDKAINYIKENELYSEDYFEEIGHTSANDEVARKDLLEILGDKDGTSDNQSS